MKIICESKREVNTVESCRQEYCCAKMKWAMNDISRGKYDVAYPHITVNGNRVKLKTHSGYHTSDEYAGIKYCPWCGKKIIVEHKKIDNTGLPATEIVQVPVQKTTSRKKHWWQ